LSTPIDTISCESFVASALEAPIGVETSGIWIAWVVGTLITVATIDSVAKIPGFTGAGPSSFDVGTSCVGVAPTIVDEALVDVLIAVDTRPPLIACAGISPYQILAGAIVATWICQAFINWIWRWSNDDTVVSTVVAASIKAAIVAGVHVRLAENVA